ncbi:uncharacterized protein LOC134272978 [Saccostrea cucullata]|uniref:uncharacterized protein LOC134272978 n=1 Tax=Saccostrea cuccullata TaxID=36930 RepID=UPI002ED4DFDA
MVKENFTGFTVNYMKPKQTTLPELTNDQGNVVVWDDCFGIWNVCNLEENERANVRNTVMNLIDNCKNKENHKAIICIDSTFVEKQLKDEIRRNIFNLSEAYRTQLSRERFRNMFDRRIYFSNISEDVGFPLLVKLIVEDHCPIEQTEEFMKNPIPKLNENFHDLFQKDRDMYVTLVYVLCNTPSVNQREIDWKAWVKLRDECASKDDGSNNQQQKRSYEYSQLEEAKNLAKGRNLIYKNPKCIELNSTLLKYLEKTENQDVFAFRHHFLAQLLLCFHNEKVGSNGILEVANEEIKSVVKRLQSSI